MLDQQDLQKIDQLMTRKFEDFAVIVNQSFEEVQEKLDVVDKRIDKLYSLVDGFIQLHQKLDQELTMLRARMDRFEEQLKQLQAQRI